MRTIDPDARPDVPDTDQMLVIHKVFRRELRLLGPMTDRVLDADVPAARRVSAHAELVLGLLHAHHDSEDRLLWPLLADRDRLDGPVVERMEEQHADIARHVAVLGPTLELWSKHARSTDRQTVATEIRAMHDVTVAHLDDEEQHMLGAVREHVSVAEWTALTDDAEKHMPPGFRERMLLVGMVLEDATVPETRWFLDGLPAPARLLWRLLGRRMYRDHVRSIRPV
jgi:hemerythrin-like domain-containing protein